MLPSSKNIIKKVLADYDTAARFPTYVEAKWLRTLASGSDVAVQTAAKEFIERLQLFSDDFADGAYVEDIFTTPGWMDIWKPSFLELMPRLHKTVASILFDTVPAMAIFSRDPELVDCDLVVNVYCGLLGRGEEGLSGDAAATAGVECFIVELVRLLDTMEGEYLNIRTEWFEQMDWIITHIAQQPCASESTDRLFDLGNRFVEWGARLSAEDDAEDALSM